MKSEINTLNCGRENDLVSFLYGELDPTEKRSFQLHMQDCAECGSQVSAFGDIRQSVVGWRDAALGSLTPQVKEPFVPRMDQSKPSAVAALREFFNLSPLWMKGTVAFASLLFCLFAVLAAVRLMETGPETTIVNKADNTPASAQQLNAEVERRVKEELQRREASRKGPAIATTDLQAVDSVGRPSMGNRQVAYTAPRRKAGRPLSKLEREELAADLRLTVDDGSGDLVLIGDRINQ